MSMRLPNEIISSLATYCPPSTLSALALSSTGLSPGIIQLLYAHIEVKSYPSLFKLSNTFIHDCRGRGQHPRSLYIDLTGQSTADTHEVILSALASIIQRSPNLQDLSLLFPERSMSDVVIASLSEIRVARLISFTCYATTTPSLVRFFNQQPGIKHLRLVENDPTNRVIFGNCFENLDAQTLPVLSTLYASAGDVSRLIPGRPVRQVDITSFSTRWSPDGIQSWAMSLSQSTVPMDTITLWPQIDRSATIVGSGFLSSFCRARVQPRRLTIKLFEAIDMFRTPGPVTSRSIELIFRDLENLDLGGFTRLETLEIIQQEGLTPRTRSRETAQLEDGLFRLIQATCPSLQVLNWFGNEMRE